MRKRLPIFSTWFCILQILLGLDGIQIFAGSGSGQIGPAAATLTNIAACLSEVRNGTNRASPVRVDATITLADRTRSLVVVQDESGALAVQLPLTGLTLRPGQQVAIRGSGVLPYVRAFPAYPDQPSGRAVLGVT
jgi:hypothetical protein